MNNSLFCLRKSILTPFQSYLIIFCTLTVSTVFADALHVDRQGFLRHENDSIYYAFPVEASKACPHGTHLPTIRELTTKSMRYGTRGIMEIDEAKELGADTDGRPDSPINNQFFEETGYLMVDSVDGNRMGDKFYFNFTGFDSSSDLPAEVWSSSVYHSQSPGDTPTFMVFYVFDWRNGVLDWSMADRLFAVQCFRN